MIQETLKHLGLSEKEIQIYLVVLQYGSIGATKISKNTQINRTTVYSVLKELVAKKLITEDLASPIAKFVARPPESIEIQIKREEEKLKTKKQWAMRAVRELTTLTQSTKYSVPKIVFVEDEDVEDHLYKQTPYWNASIKERNTLWWGFQDSHFVKHYESWIDNYWVHEPTAKGIELRLISDEVAENIKGKKYSNRKIKFWDKAKNFTATTWVMGDYVTMIFTNSRPHYLVEICDATLGHNMREIFKGLWEEISE
ncbi:MAG: hypothetical protein COV59_00415 [Candidatus Magasanikbacteria bacterium CG11_big_fil_rev_8_21_14_0_20_39_34]|uniref:Transcription regulator TrmB N-terminal domain-containing protein n=1 Tax=Candidatus Magasanikbacteria bacterium CG11_big_fil_rev_8_21_14_0_20_39_34 TaxID=1974653 RepID=A0A2H0N8W1_9BACT|nr:MAG: hypothetical protein COV59_00415 [Candidatus Magasanikbacteria bacterium CG11_big_fil_rev_8_21_14_0_20_39_34]